MSRMQHAGMYPAGGFGPSGAMGMPTHQSHMHMSQQQAMQHAYQRSMSAGGLPPGARGYPGQAMAMTNQSHQQFMFSQSQHQQQQAMMQQHPSHHMMPHPAMASRTNSCPHPPNSAVPQPRPMMGGGFYPPSSVSPFHNEFPLGSPQNPATSNAPMFDPMTQSHAQPEFNILDDIIGNGN